MQFHKILVLRGPNVWANFPVLEAWVDLGEYNDSASNELAGFNDRLMGWLPSMIEHRCSLGQRGGFFERLRRGTYPAHILEHVALELQTLAGAQVGFGRARATSEPGVYRVVVEYEEETLGTECLEAARRLILAAIHNEPFDVASEVARLRDLAQRVLLGPSTRAIVSAAVARGIPYRRLNTGSLVQLGYGKFRRRIIAAETDRTSAVAESIAQDKELTRQLLREVGIPVPAGQPVDSPEEAWEAAVEIGLPVVVKPRDAGQGRGVATGLSTREQVQAAYAAARRESDSVLVEQCVPGHDYRLLVVGDRLVAAARREPARVVGDGVHTIRELIDRVNADPRRGEHHATPLSKIHLDEVSLSVLAEQGYTAQSIPPAETVVLIRRNANLSTGGTAVDVTDAVHPAVAAQAIEAVRVVGLDIAGLDIVAEDIARPLETQRGAVVELNAAPGLRMHLAPSEGTPRPVGQAIIELMFPPGATGRIPIVAVTGVNGKTTTTRFIAHILKGTGAIVGMTTTDGIYIDDRRIDTGDCSGPKSARAVLANPAVEMAVLETARGGILREGLGFDRCDVAVVTNIGEGDHLGLSDVDTVEQLARVKRCIVEVVSPTGTAVLNAADPLVAAMAEKCPGTVLYFGLDRHHPVIARHREGGGRAVFVSEEHIVLADGPAETRLIALEHVPLTHSGKISFQVENTLAAVGSAWALGIPLDVIATRVDLFASNLEQLPGRFNVLDVRGATVMVDYGHNASALQALVRSLHNFPHDHRTVVYSTAGDRRDCDIIRQGQILGAEFDRVILYEDHYLRGREEGEIIRLFRQGLAAGPRVKEVLEVRGAIAAVETGLKQVRPGQLLLIQADTVDETVEFLRGYLRQLQAESTRAGRAAAAAKLSTAAPAG